MPTARLMSRRFGPGLDCRSDGTLDQHGPGPPGGDLRIHRPRLTQLRQRMADRLGRCRSSGRARGRARGPVAAATRVVLAADWFAQEDRVAQEGQSPAGYLADTYAGRAHSDPRLCRVTSCHPAAIRASVRRQAVSFSALGENGVIGGGVDNLGRQRFEEVALVTISIPKLAEFRPRSLNLRDVLNLTARVAWILLGEVLCMFLPRPPKPDGAVHVRAGEAQSEIIHEPMRRELPFPDDNVSARSANQIEQFEVRIECFKDSTINPESLAQVGINPEPLD